MDAKKKKELQNLLKTIDSIESKLNSKVKDSAVEVPNEKQIEKGLTEGLPTESEKYKGMSYKEALEKALLAENEAIELNALLIELAPEKDVKKFVEILSDENDHSQIYQGVLNKLNGGK